MSSARSRLWRNPQLSDKLLTTLTILLSLLIFVIAPMQASGEVPGSYFGLIFGALIVPLHPYVRGVANLEAVIGQRYPATLLARLVTPELTHEMKN